MRNLFDAQYNPDTLTRTLQVQASGRSGGDRSQALRLKGAASRRSSSRPRSTPPTGSSEPDQNPDAVELGIHPQLAALETLVHPRADDLQANDALAAAGALEMLPLEAPLTLFVWSKQRVVPVRVTDLSITEEAFDLALNPIRAKVSLGLRVLSVDDLGFDHRGGTLFMAYLRNEGGAGRGARRGRCPTLGHRRRL